MEGEVDGTVSSFFPPPSGLDHRLVRKAGRHAQTARPRSPAAKDVSVLRTDYAASRKGLFGMREAAPAGSGGAEGCSSGISQRINYEEIAMLWTIVVVLLILWLLGFSLHVAGGLIHLLLVVALVMIVINLISGRRGTA